MTKQEVVELCGRHVYEIWLQVAIRNYDPLDPQAGFEIATGFIKALLEQNPEF